MLDICRAVLGNALGLQAGILENREKLPVPFFWGTVPQKKGTVFRCPFFDPVPKELRWNNDELALGIAGDVFRSGADGDFSNS